MELGTAHGPATFECAPGRHVVPAWSKLGATKHTFYPRVPDQSVTWQEEWGRLSSQCGGRFLSSFLADSLFEENLHALRLVDPFLLPVVARRNLLVMREVSVVISWVEPKLIVDLFCGLPQHWWAMPAPTMQLREAPPEYPIEALRTDCGNRNSKLISRCRPSGDDKLDNAAWEKTQEELSSEMILGPFFDFQDVPFVYFAGLVLENSMEAPKIQL